MATTSRVKSLVITPYQYHNIVKGKNFVYHIRATSKTGAYLNKALCGGIVKRVQLTTYTDLHNAYGAGKLCSFCRNRSLG